MWGVDLLDGMVAMYRCTIKKKKWWFVFVPWSINVTCAFSKHEHSYFNFVRDLVEALIKRHRKDSLYIPRQISVCADVQDAQDVHEYCHRRQVR